MCLIIKNIGNRFPMFIASVLSSASVFAGVMGGVDGTYSPPYDGFYVGADVGLSNLLDKESHVNFSETQRLGGLGIIGGGFVGYDYSITDRVKLGLEGFGTANGLNTSTQHFNTDTSYNVSSQYSAGFRVLPGYELIPGAIGHIILGYSTTQFRIKDNGNYGFINYSTNKNGFQSGLGFLISLTQSVLIRFDGSYTTFASESKRGTSKVTPMAYQYYTNDFSTFAGDLSLVYKFN